MKHADKLAKILFLIFIAVFSITVLARKLPETAFMQNTIAHLNQSQNTIMAFSGSTLLTSLSISALPDDFASPLASTVSDMNTYFILLFAVLFVEKLVVVEGTKIALTYVIPAACILYIFAVFFPKQMFKNFGSKLLILGICLVLVIPLGTHFTEYVCKDYLVYVDQTIAEADAGAEKINEIMSAGTEESTFFEKLSDAFKTAIQDVSDLLTYFKNVIKRCVNSIAILIVTNFVLPVLIMLLFRWLLNELFALHFPVSPDQIRLPYGRKKEKAPDQKADLTSSEDKE